MLPRKDQIQMKVLLRRSTDGRYLRNSAQWTRKASGAMDFRKTTAALAFALNHSLHQAEIVLHFPNSLVQDLRLHVF